jgi:DNA-binding LacI/PurR family transcriptional regulator
MKNVNAEVTIRDVARMSGVSTMTVTRAFRHDALVSPVTRQKVLSAAEQLNYRPNLSARVLRGGSARSVGILLSNPVGHSVVRRISELLLPDNYVTYIAESLGDLKILKNVLEEFENRRVDAIVMEWRLDFYPLVSVIEKLKNVVLFTREDRMDHDCDCCFADHKPAIREAVGYLLEKGRKDICFVGRGEMVEARDTRKVLDEYGLEPKHIETSGYPSRPAFGNYYETLTEKLKEGLRPGAVLTYNDMAAVQLCRSIGDFGLKVPDDIAVIGHGNKEFAMFIQPPVASIEGYEEEIGKKVRDLLMNRLYNPDSSRRQCRVEAKFIKRESAG